MPHTYTDTQPQMSLSSERYEDLPEPFDGCDVNKQPVRPKFRLKHTLQCAKCPWKKHTNPRLIPRGYDEDKHAALANTIAKPGSLDFLGESEIHVMACHEHEKEILHRLASPAARPR